MLIKVYKWVIIILGFLYPAVELSRYVFLNMKLYPLLRSHFIAELVIFWTLFLLGALLVWDEIRGGK